MVEVSDLARLRAAHLGEQGERWVRQLPGLIADLERKWSITVGQAVAGGTGSYVARARTVDGRDAVLKLALPDPEFAGQVRTIASARGRGYVLLLASDVERYAMLQEGLGPSLDQLDLLPEAQIAALCATLRQAWDLPLPDGVTLAHAQAKAFGLAELVDRLWRDLGRPCSEAVISKALRYAEQRAHATDLDQAIVVHGDPHPANALRPLRPRAGAESGFVFVDPDGFLADPAYDLGVILRDWSPQLLAAGDASAVARRYCQLLATYTGIDATAIWEWGFVERVSTGLYLLGYGAEERARPFLTTAERLV
jgi:streptomycin 6-kinase